MKEEFLKFVRRNRLFKKDSKILAAVSGGVDSVVLCDLLYKTGVQFSVAHCNFMLRGEESEGDEKFVENMALRFQVPFYLKRFKTKAFSKENDYSVQEAASKLRYAWFEELIHSEGFDVVATAHQADDHAETVLWNLVRGTGVDGLRGISVRRKHVIRPLLFASREDIQCYAEEQGLIWREDSSNASDNYKRNFIRLHILPLLRQLNPNLSQTLLESSERLAAVSRIFKQTTLELQRKAIRVENDAIHIRIDVLKLFNEPLIGLYEILKPYGFNFRVVKDICETSDSKSGKKFISDTHILVKDREYFILSPHIEKKKTEEIIQILNEAGRVELSVFTLEYNISDVGAIDKDLHLGQEAAFLDRSLLEFPLKLRKMRAGDRFVPLGMKGSKKLSDFLVDLKVPLHRKNQVYVLTSDEKIVWVVGYRIDERFKISDKTQSVFYLRLFSNALRKG